MTYQWTTSGGFVDVDFGAGTTRPTLDPREYGVAAVISRVLSWQPLAYQIGTPKGVPLSWTLGVIYRESGGDPNAVSPVGARGLMQIMPSTASGYGRDPEALFDPVENVDIGTMLLAEFRGKGWDLPAAASMYNAGPTHGGPKHSLKSPWGYVEDTGYITSVVRANNYFLASPAAPAAVVPGSPTNGVALIAVLGLAYFAAKSGGLRG